ncbi:hypothetical protein MIMGU_mgv11b020024mg [Erythranthe guttata]|uniref:Uncharacterized protein n=4 Tax=Erythranthe guttata TaxID=4155 RepID=A0A022QAA6_ERYGU|nr:hypothetical protein MIMGU_mgv11b020024mg [Erythranthe guttata]
MGDPLGSPRVAPPPHIFLVFYPSLDSMRLSRKVERTYGSRGEILGRPRVDKRTIFTSSVGSMGLRPIDTTTASERASRAYADCVTPCVCLTKSSARTDRAEKFWGGRSIENARISPINVPFASETAREWAKRTIFTSSVGSMGLRLVNTTTASERASRAYADCVVTPPESKVINV